MTSVLEARPLCFEGFGDPPDRPIHLHHKIAVIADAASAFEFVVGNDRRMRASQGKIEKERFGRFRGVGNQFHRLARQGQRRCFGRILLPRPGVPAQTEIQSGPAGRCRTDNPVILDKRIGREVWRVHAEVVIKAAGSIGPPVIGFDQSMSPGSALVLLANTLSFAAACSEAKGQFRPRCHLPIAAVR